MSSVQETTISWQRVLLFRIPAGLLGPLPHQVAVGNPVCCRVLPGYADQGFPVKQILQLIRRHSGRPRVQTTVTGTILRVSRQSLVQDSK